MKRHVLIEKNIGETPLMAIEAWKKLNQEYADMPASYAGRLDPMASGKLLVLFGEECKKQKSYTNLDKEYEVEVLFGVGSDTGDILGLSIYAESKAPISSDEVQKAISNELGAHLRAYPVFSSKTVKGKPLFTYALAGTLESISVPEHIEQVYRVQILDTYKITTQELSEKIFGLLTLVPRTEEPSKVLGENFRIDAVRAGWESIFNGIAQKDFLVVRLRVVCASGTYMRSLAPRVGQTLGTKALALSIKRTKIGKYIPLWRGAGFWLKQY